MTNKTNKTKNKTFKIHYYFDGYGEVLVEAENEEKAREKFLQGEFEGENNQWGENYGVINSIEEA